MHFDIYPRIKPVMPNQPKECRYWNDFAFLKALKTFFSLLLVTFGTQILMICVPLHYHRSCCLLQKY